MPEQGNHDQTAAMQAAEFAQNPDRRTGFRHSRLGRITATLTVAALGAGIIGGYELLSDEGSAQTPADAATLAQGDVSQAEVTTDAQLRELDKNVYNCGGHLQPAETTGKYSTDYALDYYNSNPELGDKMRQFHIDTLGESAWKSLLANGMDNGDTTANKHFKGNSEVDQLLHKRTVAKIKESRTYANFTCVVNGKVDIQRAGNKPTITIPTDNRVEGITLNKAGLDDFMAKVKKNADGGAPVDVVDVGEHQVNDNGKTITEHLFLVALYADGCDNPILRLTPPTPNKETTTTTAPKSTTTTTPQTTTTTRPTTTTTQPLVKHDDGVLPGDGTPASQDKGTPDKAGTGPAGQTPNTIGYVPGEQVPTTPVASPNTSTTTTTQPKPPATTGAAPTSTNPPVTATTSAPQPPVQRAPLPTRP